MTTAGRVFMLDDDRIFLDLYRHFLETHGYEVFVTDNAYQFLLYGQEVIPDLLILDINMPRLNGWEVLQRIGQNEVLRNIPVVMLSVNQDEDLAALKGVAHFLAKPLAMEALEDILTSYCQGNRNHDLLLIEDYHPLFGCPEKGRCFVIHTVGAAKRYLQKNKPAKIAVRYDRDRFEQAKQELQRDDLLQVTAEQNMSDVVNK